MSGAGTGMRRRLPLLGRDERGVATAVPPAFVMTGYKLPGASASDWLNPANNCSGSSKCIDGYFTRGIIPSTGSMGGTCLGCRGHQDHRLTRS